MLMSSRIFAMGFSLPFARLHFGVTAKRTRSGIVATVQFCPCAGTAGAGDMAKMGMNLHGELEPLLSKLREAADTKFYNDIVTDPTNEGTKKIAQQGLVVFNDDVDS